MVVSLSLGCSLTENPNQLAVVKNEGPDFYVEVEKVPVPEIGTPFLRDVLLIPLSRVRR